MDKAWCIWCEIGDNISTSGYFWIHQKCADELMDISSNLKNIREILEGIHHRNELNPNQDKIDTVLNFLKDMEDFKRKWDGTMKLANDLGFMRNVKPSIEENSKGEKTLSIEAKPLKDSSKKVE